MNNSREEKTTTRRASYVSGFVIILASVSIALSCWTGIKNAQQKPTETVIEYKQEPQSQAMIDEIARLKNEISQLSLQVTQLNAQVQQMSLDQPEMSAPSSVPKSQIAQVLDLVLQQMK